MSAINEFIQANAVDGQLTTEQAAELLELAMKGDTGNLPESSDAPDAATVPDVQTDNEAAQASAAQADGEEQELDPARTVIQAKDGIHTIPYDSLLQERAEKKELRSQLQERDARIEAMQRELEAARAAAQQRADAGEPPTQADRNLALAEQAVEMGADPSLFGDYSEEAIAKGLATLVKQQVDLAMREQQRLQAQEQAATEHDRAIYTAHPDADAIGQSRELQEWINAKVEALPVGVRASARAGYEQVLATGTAQEVIDLLDAFKRDTGRTQPAADAKSAAKAAIAGVKPSVPASLSDIPGGTAGPSSRFETLANLAPADMSTVMAGMNPEQIEAFLNRNG